MILDVLQWVTIGLFICLLAVFAAAFLKALYDGRTYRLRSDIAAQAVKAKKYEKSLNEIVATLQGPLTGRGSAEVSSTTTALMDGLASQFISSVASTPGLTKEEINAQLDARTAELQEKIKRIEERFPDAEDIDKIASINDALFADRIKGLSDQVEKLESKTLTKWDVALVVCSIITAIVFVLVTGFGVLSYIESVKSGPGAVSEEQGDGDGDQ